TKNMSKYRFKTKEEFKKTMEMCHEGSIPKHWNIEMKDYLGKDIPLEFNERCDNKGRFKMDKWSFYPKDYVLKEELNTNGFEYFGDTLMEVSDNNDGWVERVVFGKKDGRYIAWVGDGNLEGIKEECDTVAWDYARPIKTKITIQEVADKFGLDVNEIEIVDCKE